MYLVLQGLDVPGWSDTQGGHGAMVEELFKGGLGGEEVLIKL